MSQYVVVDLEMCQIPVDKRKAAGYGRTTETIQIGAVLLNEQFEIADEFNSFVKPELGFMDTRIMQLTGISSTDLIDAPFMKEALIRFIDWIPADAKVVSWSESDLEQIRYEALKKGISHERLESILDEWIDCQKMFMDKISVERKYKLSEALIIADIDQEGHEHNGLADAYNTAKLFAKMMTEPELKLNSYYMKAQSGEERHSGFSIADAFSNIKFD